MANIDFVDDFDEAFEEACEMQETQRRIDELEMSYPSDTDAVLRKQDGLQELRKKLQKQNEDYKARYRRASPADFVKELKAKGKRDCEIAAELQNIYKLKTYQIGRLLPAKSGSAIKPESASKRGRVLLKKAKIGTG